MTTTLKTCILDMDGVLADFTSAVNALEGRPLGYQPPNYNFVARESWDKMDLYFWRNLNPTPECFDIVKAVESRFGPENVIIATSPVLTFGCPEGKIEWLRIFLPRYARRFAISPVKEFFANPSTVLIDDADEWCGKFVARGGNVLQVPRSYNSRREVVGSWDLEREIASL